MRNQIYIDFSFSEVICHFSCTFLGIDVMRK